MVSVSYGQMGCCHGTFGKFWECTGTEGNKQSQIKELKLQSGGVVQLVIALGSSEEEELMMS